MMAEIVARFDPEGRLNMSIVPISFDYGVDIVFGVRRDDGHIRSYGIKVYGEANPYKAFAALEHFAAGMKDVETVTMINNELKGYGK